MGAYSFLVKPYEPSAKKRFGQHFLRDTGVIERIVRWIQPAPEDLFLDIGAGDGAISTRLAPRVARLLAIEIDLDCIPRLKANLSASPSAAVVRADFLHLDLDELVQPVLQPGTRLRIAGNLPYNIATAIIEKIVKSGLPVSDMFFMVQLEVAHRITANPGTHEYGFLSVFCQHHCDVRMGFKVSQACFVPRPQVSSAMISLHPKQRSAAPEYESVFEALAKAAFAYRRKTLTNSLTRDPVFGRITAELLSRAGIDGSRRAEELTIREFETLAQIYRDCFQPPRS